MFQQWRANNQTIRDNLEDDDEEEYMMNQLVYKNHIDSFDDEHIHTGGSEPDRKPNKYRLVLFHSKLLYNDYFSKTPIFNVVFFARFVGCASVFFCKCTILFVRMMIILSINQIA